jgi:formylglycine-generating enzyme required for sulfatase activity
MSEFSYESFRLLVERLGENRYRARAFDAPSGDVPPVEFSLNFHPDELAAFDWLPGRLVRAVRPVVQPGAQQSRLSPQEFGKRLFETVFAGELGGLFGKSLVVAREREAGLRLRLSVDETSGLAELPWEFLYAPSLGRFLALSNETPLVRSLTVPQPRTPLHVSPPLRILVAVSNPPDVFRLDVEQEWERLVRALADLEDRDYVELERLPRATLTALQDRLRDQDQGVHVFHFIGHGYFDAKDGAGGLVFEGEAGDYQDVPAEDLAMHLCDHRPLRLAFVNACHGAQDGRKEPFAGVAQKMIQQGVPAVVAMQYPISDCAALDLAQEFYEAVADGYPIDVALTEARKRVKSSGNEFEWGTPVLFVRAREFMLFELPAPLPHLELSPMEPEMVPVRGGSFLMGSDPGPGIPEYETPQFSLDLPSYYVGKYPVTNRQYAEFLRRSRGVKAPPGWYGRLPPPGAEDHPVAGVSWYDARAYCEWLTKEVTETGGTYALPSEAQWEKAARGTHGRIYPWGDEWDEEKPRCNLDSRRTTPVDAYPQGASPYGCLDMVGNVREWTRTLWGEGRFEPDRERCYPWKRDGHNDDHGVVNPEVRRAFRGGSEPGVEGPLRAAIRGSQVPGDPGLPGARLGFRVVLSGVDR